MDAHTTWCARGHRCNLGEHRATSIIVKVPGAGTAVLTRVRAGDGTEYAEIRLRATLPTDEPAARLRLAALLTHVRTLLGPDRTAARRAA